MLPGVEEISGLRAGSSSRSIAARILQCCSEHRGGQLATRVTRVSQVPRYSSRFVSGGRDSTWTGPPARIPRTGGVRTVGGIGDGNRKDTLRASPKDYGERF